MGFFKLKVGEDQNSTFGPSVNDTFFGHDTKNSIKKIIDYFLSFYSTTKTATFDRCIYVKNLHLFFLGITSFF